jgi:hypothetical protein
MDGIVAGGIKLEGLAHERSLGRMNDNRAQVAVVDVASWRAVGPDIYCGGA